MLANIEISIKGDKMFNQRELNYLEEILNEEILSYLRSGYGLDNEYVVTLRGMLEKLGLKELYTFARWSEDYEEVRKGENND